MAHRDLLLRCGVGAALEGCHGRSRRRCVGAPAHDGLRVGERPQGGFGQLLVRRGAAPSTGQLWLRPTRDQPPGAVPNLDQPRNPERHMPQIFRLGRTLSNGTSGLKRSFQPVPTGAAAPLPRGGQPGVARSHACLAIRGSRGLHRLSAVLGTGRGQSGRAFRRASRRARPCQLRCRDTGGCPCDRPPR